MFVCRIHNNTLAKCVEIANEERGIEIIKTWCAEQGFELSAEDEDGIEENLEYCHDFDPENIYTFAIGNTEEDAVPV